MLTLLKKHMKIVKTSNIFLNYFVMGMSLSMFGPCLLDLQYQLHTGFHSISYMYLGRCIGMLTGSILGGIILDLVKYKQAVMTICNLVGGSTLFAVPWIKSIGAFIATMTLSGLAFGVIGTGGNVLCLQLWGEKSSPVLQILQFTFGIGCFVSPMIAGSIHDNLDGYSNSTNYDASLEDSSFLSVDNSSNNFSYVTNTSQRFPRITYTFCIVGACVLLLTLLYMATSIISPIEDEDLQEAKADDAERSFLFLFLLSVFIFLVFFAVGGIELGFGHSLTTYAVKGKLHATTSTGSYMTSAFWAAYTISRLLSVYLLYKLSNVKMLICDIVIVSIATLILLFMVPHEWMLWLASILLGTGMASIFGALLGWLNSHVFLSNKIASIFSVGIITGEIVLPFLITYYVETDPEVLSYTIAAMCVLLVFFLLALHCIFKYGMKKESATTLELSATESGLSHNTPL